MRVAPLKILPHIGVGDEIKISTENGGLLGRQN